MTPQLLKKIREDPGGLVGSLENLDLSSNNLAGGDIIMLAKALNAHATHCGGVCSPLLSINLRNNNVCSMNTTTTTVEGEEERNPEYKGFQMFCKAMQNSRYIRVLNVSENILGAPGFKAIFDLLDTSNSLHELM